MVLVLLHSYLLVSLHCHQLLTYQKQFDNTKFEIQEEIK